MASFRTTRRVRHAATDMFDLVADVERYPEFVPLCRELRVKKREQLPDGTTHLVAEMGVAYGLFRERFTSRVALDPAKSEISVTSSESPFRSMQNLWRFRAEGERACEVEFAVAYEFRSRALELLIGSVFDAAFRRFADAFERRADAVYGRAGAA
jgi:coenzyme Q-binding protein COQ10